MIRALLLLLVAPAFGIPATTTLTLVEGDDAYNRLRITVDPGFGLADTEVSTLTGTIVADLQVDPATSQAGELTLRDGRVDASAVRFERSVFLVGRYDISASGLSGQAVTPSPPGSVTPATGDFDASQFGFRLDQGSLTGSATFLGTTNPVNQVIDPADPVTGQGSGNGTILITAPRDSGPYTIFDISLNLPVHVDDSFDANGTSVALTATGTLRAVGTLEVPRSEYLAWTVDEGIADAAPNGDANGDGVANGFAWACGLGAFEDARAWRPVALTDGGFEIRLPPSSTLAPIRVKVSTSLEGWTDLAPGRLSGGLNPLPIGSSGTQTVAPSGSPQEFLILEVSE